MKVIPRQYPLIFRVPFSWTMIPTTLTVVSATLLVATIVIGAGLSFKANIAIAQVMGNMDQE